MFLGKIWTCPPEQRPQHVAVNVEVWRREYALHFPGNGKGPG